MPTRRVVKVRESCEVERAPDGTWHVTFPPLELRGTGATEDAAWEALAAAINDKLRNDSGAQPAWEAFVRDHSVDEEIPEPDLRDRDEIIARSHEASAGFRALDLQSLREDAGPLPLLVDFWAEWCMPCHMLAPTLREVADALTGRLEVVKVNVDDNPDAHTAFSIEGIPTVILLRNGKEVQRFVGAGRSTQSLVASLEPYLV